MRNLNHTGRRRVLWAGVGVKERMKLSNVMCRGGKCSTGWWWWWRRVGGRGGDDNCGTISAITISASGG